MIEMTVRAHFTLLGCKKMQIRYVRLVMCDVMKYVVVFVIRCEEYLGLVLGTE